MFKQAIVRKVSKMFHLGITSANLGKPDYNFATIQHSEYIKALKKCGLNVKILEADDQFPDSTFIEDTAVIDKDFGVISNFGALSRSGEEIEIKEILKEFFTDIEDIKRPGTLEGGDVMKVENEYYIGISKRTNKQGAMQLKKILQNHGFSCTLVTLKKVLHLKTGIAYIGDNNLVVSTELIKNPIFKGYNIIEVEEDESYATNCIRVNKYMIIAKGFNKFKTSLIDLGYKILEIDMSEFRKMDGGLSCLSLRF
ncbi:MAG: dimethylarginine dimethylaminohydrolase family protein [Promethearchaeota archaeon]|jgi:dimethylargininase